MYKCSHTKWPGVFCGTLTKNVYTTIGDRVRQRLIWHSRCRNFFIYAAYEKKRTKQRKKVATIRFTINLPVEMSRYAFEVSRPMQ